MENVILRQQLQQARDELERRVEEHAAELSRAKALSEHEIAEREAAVEEVKESRRQVLDILESITDAFLALDTSWRFTYVNRNAAKFLGKKKEQLLFRYIWDVFPEAFGSTFSREFERAVEQKVPVMFEEFYPPLNKWFEVHAYPYKSGLTIYFRDVTVRKKIEKQHEQLLSQVKQQHRHAEKLAKEAKQRSSELEAIFNALADPVIIYDAEGVLVRANPAAVKAYGLDPVHAGRKAMARSMRVRFSDGRAAGEEELASSRALRGEHVIGERFIYSDATGKDVIAEVSSTPIVYDDKVVGVVSIWHDVTVREQLLGQVERQRQNARELAIAFERERDTLETIMENTNAQIAYLDAQFNFVLVNSAYEKGSGHARAELIGRNHFELFPNAENEAIFRRVRDTGERVEFKAKPFEFVDQPWRGATYWDWTLTPIKDTPGHVIGLVLSLVDVTDSIRARQLSDALNSINAEINSTLDFSEIMTRVVIDSAKNMGSEGGVVLLREVDRWVVGYTYGFPPEITGTKLTDDEARHATVAASTGKPVAVDDTSNDERVNRRVMEKYGTRSILTVPLIVRHDVIGALCFCYRSSSISFTETQIDFANKLATSVSLSLENARLYAAERNIADTLQEALLILPEQVDGVVFGHLYRSATEAAKVGGDFYDIFELEHDRVGIIIGDVSGKGLEAAALTSIVKNTIKAQAYEGGTPALIMAKANDLVAKTSPADIFVTVFFGILDTKTGKLTYCSAGHPPALIKRSTGHVDALGTQSPVIGAFTMINYASGKVILETGDVLVLYTDGIIEARCNREFFGEKRLVEAVKALRPTSPQEMPGALFNEVMHCTGGKLSDDIALLCVSLDRGVTV